MTSYEESRKKLAELRQVNEVMFRMAISHLLDCGYRNCTDEMIEATCAEIMQEDDSKKIMTNEFKCDLVRMTGELAKIDHIHLLVYISREMFYSVDDKHISYTRAISLLKSCISWVLADDNYDIEDTQQAVMEMGFNDDELDELDYGWIMNPEEE